MTTIHIKHILLFALLLPLFIKAQTLELAIQDKGQPVLKNSILKNGTVHKANADSFISVPVKSNDRITIKHKFYKDFSFQLPEDLKGSDTINMVIELTPNFQSLDEFIVSGSKYQNVFKNKNEFIIDYYPIPLNDFIVTTHLKGNYYIKIIDESGEEKIIKKLNFKPQKIFLDVMGNFHLINKDSVVQIYNKNDSIHLMNSISKYDFESKLKNLVSFRDNCVFLQKINKHNQLFSLYKLINFSAPSKEEMRPSTTSSSTSAIALTKRSAE